MHGFLVICMLAINLLQLNITIPTVNTIASCNYNFSLL